jgi:hypothetical protein
MDREGLRAIWEEAFSRPPPSHAGDDYIRAVMAYRIQEEAGSRLSAVARRRLKKIAAGVDGNPNHRRSPTTRMKEGSKLLREWNGETHEVSVLDGGFEYRGTRYRSLSAIAREITGARWSGPRFFGLRGEERVHAP